MAPGKQSDHDIPEGSSGPALPLILECPQDGAAFDLAAWVRQNARRIESAVLRHGAVLFREFPIHGATEFDGFVRTISGEPMEYRERSSPRLNETGRIYTSTEHPARQEIFLHNELSYARTFPLRLYFLCHVPAARGGATPLADSRRILRRIPADIREMFRVKQWMYTRNFNGGAGLTWETAFGTSNRSEVEAYCRGANIDWQWLDGGRLRTRQVRPAVLTHPRSGEEVWFNHACFFHVSTLDAPVREALLACFPEEDLPNQTYFGDGSRIPEQVAGVLRECYESEKVAFPWRQNDVLLIDNMLTSHGRSAFEGSRKVLVAMAEAFTRPE
jgi:alpha-ketoglutarate-dependent taurine dioxygenase